MFPNNNNAQGSQTSNQIKSCNQLTGKPMTGDLSDIENEMTKAQTRGKFQPLLGGSRQLLGGAESKHPFWCVLKGNTGESESKPGIKMVCPKQCKELTWSHLDMMIWVGTIPHQPFISGFDCGPGKLFHSPKAFRRGGGAWPPYPFSRLK